MREGKNSYDLLVIGGGAAGFFGAICYASENPDRRVAILEKSSKLLSKVKISGGGRCNVTHACFDPREMIQNYPRGSKELMGPFNRFLCGDMMGWLSDQEVNTKIEEDGRVFPDTDRSQTIIDCFLTQCEKHQIDIKTNEGLVDFKKNEDHWIISTKDKAYQSQQVLFATGSSPAVWKLLKTHNYQIVEPVPSLFTFKIKSKLLDGLPGISVPDAEVKINDTKFRDNGPLLITHWGLSGPAVLKLSSWAARTLHEKFYKFQITINWCHQAPDVVKHEIETIRQQHGKKSLVTLAPMQLPKRLWQRMVTLLDLQNVNYASLSKKQINRIAEFICNCQLEVDGKSTFKDEFVTCGGVDTRQVNFKTMESKIDSGIFFAGEVLNIDAVTGGFNFQAAWTTAYVAAEAMK